MSNANLKRADKLILLALIILVALVYSRACSFDLLSIDDDRYVLHNEHVQAGLSAATFKWAFTTNTEANWHPLTWLSLAMDTNVAKFLSEGIDRETGPNHAAVYHDVNVYLHILNTLLLFALLSRVTGRRWPSAIVAALFAVHPTHVESVAWVAERKDVLSTLLWLLTTWSYVRYVGKPSLGKYAATAALFALGLMAKPMLVSLPIMLLLMDIWPLRRVTMGGSRSEFVHKLLRLAREKWALWVLAAASCVVTTWAQHAGMAMSTLGAITLGARVGNALISYAEYLRMLIWPSGLAYFYPHPLNNVSVFHAIASGVLLVLLTILVFRQARRRPEWLVGWLWFVITLVPVIGLVQVGTQAFADRYTYVPYIGLFIAIAFTVIPEGKPLSKVRATGTAVAAIAIVGALSVVAYTQTGYWQDSRTLYKRAIAVTQRNGSAHYQLGVEFVSSGEYVEAEREFRLSVKYDPNFGQAECNLASALTQLGRDSEAEAIYRSVLKKAPDAVEVRLNLACVLYNTGRTDEARKEFEEVLKFDPANERAIAALDELGGR